MKRTRSVSETWPLRAGKRTAWHDVPVPDDELLIRGYETAPGRRTVDASALVGRPGFWPAYLYSLTGNESVWEAFAADPADGAAVTEALKDPQRWPVISVRLAPAAPGRWYWLRVVHRNFPDDAGVDFLVSSDLGGTAITIASLEGHFRGPGACWEELAALADGPDPVLSAAQRLLLALPLLGDVDRPGSARAVVAAALASVGATGDADPLAGSLLDDPPMWSHATWEIRQGVRMCRGTHAVRHVQDLSLNHLREVDLAFGGRYYRGRAGRREYGRRAAGRTMPRWLFEVTGSRVDDGVGLRLRGHLHGELRDTEPARLVDAGSAHLVGAVHLDGEDGATRQLVIAIRDTTLAAPAPGASLHPVD